MDENQISPDLNELQAQCQWLRKQVQITLILLIMVSGIFTLYLQRQNKYATLDLNSVQPMIEDYTKNQQPVMDDFIKRLLDYGKTHSDFGPIYTRYGLDKLTLAPTNGAAKK